MPFGAEQELSYRKQIASQLRTQYVEGIYDNPVTLKYRLTVTQGNWKRNHWVDNTRLTTTRGIGRWIFSVKKWRDLENQVRGRSRSLKVAPFDRPYATFYWSTIVNIALSCTIFEFYTLKSGLEVTQCHWAGAIRKLECGFLFDFYSNCGRICSRSWHI